MATKYSIPEVIFDDFGDFDYQGLLRAVFGIYSPKFTEDLRPEIDLQIDSLAPEYRFTIQLRFRGQNHKAISQIIGASQYWSQNKEARALRMLRHTSRLGKLQADKLELLKNLYQQLPETDRKDFRVWLEGEST